MEDTNFLDFLESPPKRSRPTERYPTSPFVSNSIDEGYGKKKHSNKKKLEMAQSIAKADELLRVIDRLKIENNEFQSQLKDFQRTAQEIQILYSKEKKEHEAIKKRYSSLEMKYKNIDADLINKTMENDQMKARLEDYEGRPINFNALVVKYVKLMNKLEGDDVLKYSSDKDLLERLKDYCHNMKLKISSNKSPKIHKVKTRKIKTVEAFVQCNLYEEPMTPTKTASPPTKIHNVSERKEEISTVASSTQCNLIEENVTAKVTTKDRTTQCYVSKRDQGSQYISTMITRQTNTEKVIQKHVHVQTMFPEDQTGPPVDDILNTFIKWAHIRSVSPLQESAPHISTQEQLKSFKTIGTCTMLCNIRRKIDYLPPNISKIKQEIITPSASPIPNTQRITMNRQCNTMLPNVNVNTSNQNQHHTILNLLNTAANTSSLGEFTCNAFNELWQIFGKMLLNLLQSSNAGISNSHANSTINQQQFLDWLMGLYVSSQPQATASAETQTVEESVPMTSHSPVSFNSSSSLFVENILRPQAQKAMPNRANSTEMEAAINSEPSQDYTDSAIDMEIQQINTFSNSIESSVETQKNDHELTFNSISCAKENVNKPKNSILEQNQAPITETKLSKKKRKALKRLKKKKYHEQKLYNIEKDPIKEDNFESTGKTSEDCNEHFETAVDFLKMFTNTQGNTEICKENFTKNDNPLEQCAGETSESKRVMDNANDFNFIKPSYTSPKRHKKSITSSKDTFLKPATKCKTQKSSKNVENKYQLLFGDSDSESDEMESECDERNKKPVIKSIINLSNNTSLEYKTDIKRDLANSQDCQDHNLNNTLVPIYKEESSNSTTVDHQSQTFKNKPNSLPDNPKPIFKQMKTTFIENEPLLNIKSPKADTTCKETLVYDSPLNLHGITSKENKPTDTVVIKSTTQNNEPLTVNSINAGNELPSLDDDVEDKEIQKNFDTNIVYTSDFEKDFEISSDDESLPCDNESVFSSIENLAEATDNESKNILSIENQDTEKQDKDCVEELPENIDNKSYEKNINSNISAEYGNSEDFNFLDTTSAENETKKKSNRDENDQSEEATNSLQHDNSVENNEQISSLDCHVITISDSTEAENLSKIMQETPKENEVITFNTSPESNEIGDMIADKEDQNNFSDSFDNGLSIDEGPAKGTEQEFDAEQLSSYNAKNNSLNSSSISTILNTSLYNEVLSESVNVIVDDILKDQSVDTPPQENRHKQGRKRKTDPLNDLLPCKRSQRLKAQQIILESSLNLSNTPIEIGKYTKKLKDSPWKELIQSEKITHLTKKNSSIDFECKATETNNLSISEMGFFTERRLEAFELNVPQSHETFNISKEKDFQSRLMPSKIRESCLEESIGISNQMGNETRSNQQQVQVPTNSQPEVEINIEWFESPQSPAPAENHETESKPACVIPTERPPQFVPKQGNQTLLDMLINSYSMNCHKEVTQNVPKKERQQQNMIVNEFEKLILQYCYNEMELDSDCTAMRLINKLLSVCPEYKLIYTSIIQVSQKVESTQVLEKDLPSIIQEMPPRHLSKCMQRLFPVVKNFLTKNHCFCIELMEQIELVLFCPKPLEKLSLDSTLNLTQLYLMACRVQESIGLEKNPTRLFIAKCLYFYVQKSILMIHEVLMWYPTVLPYREDKTYDRSDALITVIVHILMNTKYDMDKSELRGRSLLSKLRYEYHFEPFKPKAEEIVNVLIEKLKSKKSYNLYQAFCLLCKRLGVQHTQNVILLQHLLPLAQEYYCLALKTNEFDDSIAILLEVISMVLKPFPSNTDVKSYLNEFSRFLNNIERPIIQEAALCAILRLQRFGVDNCYNSLRHFQPNFELKTSTQAMLKTFLYRRTLTFWKTKTSENSVRYLK